MSRSGGARFKPPCDCVQWIAAAHCHCAGVTSGSGDPREATVPLERVPTVVRAPLAEPLRVLYINGRLDVYIIDAKNSCPGVQPKPARMIDKHM
jgi:hypothetical protein